jgi:hypothetical protein
VTLRVMRYAGEVGCTSAIPPIATKIVRPQSDELGQFQKSLGRALNHRKPDRAKRRGIGLDSRRIAANELGSHAAIVKFGCAAMSCSPTRAAPTPMLDRRASVAAFSAASAAQLDVSAPPRITGTA